MVCAACAEPWRTRSASRSSSWLINAPNPSAEHGAGARPPTPEARRTVTGASPSSRRSASSRRCPRAGPPPAALLTAEWDEEALVHANGLNGATATSSPTAAAPSDRELRREEVATQGAVSPPARGEERGGYGRKEPPTQSNPHLPKASQASRATTTPSTPTSSTATPRCLSSRGAAQHVRPHVGMVPR